MLEPCTALPDMGCATSVHTPTSPNTTHDQYLPTGAANIEDHIQQNGNSRINENANVTKLDENRLQDNPSSQIHHHNDPSEDVRNKSTDVASNGVKLQTDSNDPAKGEGKDKPVILELLVDRVVEKHTTELLLEEIKAENELEAKNKQNEISGKNITSHRTEKAPVVETEIEHDTNSEESNQEECEEDEESGVSPSEGVISRATRWEALADIAAELPASLTVDPLTGQIYALAK